MNLIDREDLFRSMALLEATDFTYRDEDPRKPPKRETYVRLDALYDLFRAASSAENAEPLNEQRYQALLFVLRATHPIGKTFNAMPVNNVEAVYRRVVAAIDGTDS